MNNYYLKEKSLLMLLRENKNAPLVLSGLKKH